MQEYEALKLKNEQMRSPLVACNAAAIEMSVQTEAERNPRNAQEFRHVDTSFL